MTNPAITELNRKFQEAYQQKTLLVCLYGKEQDIHDLTGHPEFPAEFPTSCDLTSLTHQLLVTGLRPNLWFTYNHEAGLEQLFHRLDFHFYWLTRHREHQQPVLWLHESAFLILSAMLDERTRKKIRILHLPTLTSDYGDQLLVPVRDDQQGWEQSKRRWELELLELNRKLLRQELPLLERLYHAQHQIRLLKHHLEAEQVRAHWELVQVHWAFVKQGQTGFLVELLEQMDHLTAFNIFTVPAAEAMEMVHEAIKIHLNLIEAEGSKSPAGIRDHLWRWLLQVLGKATPNQLSQGGAAVFQQVFQESDRWNTSNSNSRSSQLDSLVRLFRIVAAGLSESEVLHHGKQLLERLEGLHTLSGSRHLILQCRLAQVRRLMELHSVHQQGIVDQLLAWVRTYHLHFELLDFLAARPLPYAGDQNILLELLSEVIDGFHLEQHKKTSNWEVLADLYHQRSRVQPDVAQREQDLRKALELYRKAWQQSLPQASSILDSWRPGAHLCLPMARIHRALRGWEEGLQLITEGIWSAQLEAVKRPLRGSFTSQEHLEGELVKHLEERVLILEDWIKVHPEKEVNLTSLLRESQQTLAYWKSESEVKK